MGLEKKMKIGFNKLTLAVILATVAVPSWAAGTIIATAVIGLTAGSFAAVATAFVINMAISAIITKAFFSPQQPGGDGGLAGDSPNPGNRQQVPPATDNKLPVVYGEAWLGGTITDLSITSNNQDLYYVLSICEVTNNGYDTITFGDVYWGGKRCNFEDSTSPNVVSLTDESTGTTDSSVNGKLQIFMYRNGSNTPVRGGSSAIAVMNSSGLTYTWDNSKLMTNCAFAIIHITYNSDAGLTGIQQTKFQVTNSRYAPGDCFLDYLTNEVYGAAIPISQVDTASLTALNAYCAQSFSYTDAEGNPATQARFRFDGVVDTNRSIMDNLQDMASSCDALLKYNEIVGQWGIITQSPTYSVSMDLNDSNMVSAIQITPLDIAASYNVIECKFPDNSNQDAFNSTTFDLAEIDPTLLFPNEPVNKNSVSLPLVNNDVRAQYIATRMLKAGREDLQVNVRINFEGIQLEAGDIVTVTNSNYGWAAKLFRVMKVTEQFASDGAVTADLILTEFNPAVYDDTAVTQFQPSPNTGIPNPLVFGTIPAPTISNLLPSAINPSFDVIATTPVSGIVQYAEIWYSAFSTPTTSQLIFAGTTAIQANGNPYPTNTAMPAVTLGGIPAGTWYFFTRMVNSLGTSAYSSASSAVVWLPLTFQYTNRYLCVAYADDAAGTGFTFSPNNKGYFGLVNISAASLVTNPALYSWYDVSPDFGSTNFLLYANRQDRRFTFAAGNAVYASQTGAYVPADTSIYDQSIWSALPDGTNIIDLDARTGQLIRVGTSSISTADGLIKIVNNQSGQIIAQLDKFLNFGEGVNQKTFSVSDLTIDVYGRVVGVTTPDSFYYTETVFNATAGQDTFSVTHIVGQILVFKNGVLVDSTDYIETSTTVVLDTPCIAGEKVVVLNMRAVSALDYYEPLNLAIASSSSNSITYDTSSLPYQHIEAGDLLTFSNTGTPTTYTVSSVNYSTRTITFTTTISGATAGNFVYRFRAQSSEYVPFSKYEVSLSGASDYTPTEWAFQSGYELIFVNGVIYNEIDYDLTSGTFSGLPAPISGKLTIIQFSQNSFTVPCSAVTNTLAASVSGQTVYTFAHNPLAFQLYANGVVLANGYDFTDNSTTYSLVTTYDNNYTLLQQQTFARAGAA